MDLSIYMIVATFVVFFTGAAVALAWSLAAGHWAGTARAARLVLEIDDPYPGQQADDETGA